MKLPVLLLDFGGVIDSDGVHTRVQFWEAAREVGALGRSRSEFQEGYSRADALLMGSSDDLFSMNVRMARSIGHALRIMDDEWALAIGQRVTQMQAPVIEQNARVIRTLSKEYSIGIVSNFTGNLKVILQQFGILEWVETVSESFHEGFSKPDVRLFQIALERMGASPNSAWMVGDHLERDLQPAKVLGLGTILVKNGVYSGQDHSVGEAVDAVIPHLRALPEMLQSMKPIKVHDSSTQR